MVRPKSVRRRSWRIWCGRSRKDAWNIVMKFIHPKTEREVRQNFRTTYARAVGYKTWIVPIRRRFKDVIPTRSY